VSDPRPHFNKNYPLLYLLSFCSRPQTPFQQKLLDAISLVFLCQTPDPTFTKVNHCCISCHSTADPRPQFNRSYWMPSLKSFCGRPQTPLSKNLSTAVSLVILQQTPDPSSTEVTGCHLSSFFVADPRLHFNKSYPLLYLLPNSHSAQKCIKRSMAYLFCMAFFQFVFALTDL
jgi:hypothetical protein